MKIYNNNFQLRFPLGEKQRYIYKKAYMRLQQIYILTGDAESK